MGFGDDREATAPEAGGSARSSGQGWGRLGSRRALAVGTGAVAVILVVGACVWLTHAPQDPLAGPRPAAGKSSDHDGPGEGADQPRAAALHLMRLQTGGPNVEVPVGALGKAALHVGAMRDAVRKQVVRRPDRGVAVPVGRPLALAKAAVAPPNASVQYQLAGMPVGPLPGDLTGAGGAVPPGPPDPKDGMLPLELARLPRAGAAAAVPPGPGGIDPARWKWLGPGNIGGRTRALLIHPTTPNVMWLGAVAGGIWKTVDGGKNWSPLAAFQANLNVSCLVMDPADPLVIYAGTGEGFANVDANRGEGVFRTTDGGKTWDQLAQTSAPAFRYVNRLALSSDGRVMLAATPSGIFRSTTLRDAMGKLALPAVVMFPAVGAPVAGETLDVRFHPTDPALCVAGGREGKAFFSIDGGVHWTPSAGIIPVPLGPFRIGGRVELTYARAGGSKVVYASVDSDTGILYRSNDGGRNFAPTGNTVDFLAGQGWYDNTVWAGDPGDDNLVLVGGVELYRSTDGGSLMTPVTDWALYPASSPHADQHFVASHPGFGTGNNRTVFVCSDGGVYKTEDVRTATPAVGWTSLNHGLGITQFYNASANATSGRVLGGAQDNGTLLYTPAGGPEGFILSRKGDGGFCAFDPTDPKFGYFEYVFGFVFRSTNGGESETDWITDAPNGVSGEVGQNKAPFIAPFILDPNNARVMYFGSQSVFRTSDVRAATPKFIAVKPPLPGTFVSAIGARRTGVATTGDSNAVWVGHDDGSVFRSLNANAAAPAWAQVNGPGLSPMPKGRMCTRVVLDPAGEKRIFVCFAGYFRDNLWQSLDGGATWAVLGLPPPEPAPSDVLKDFPDVSVYDVAIHPDHPAFLYVATEVGILASGDDGATWAPTSLGPANVATHQLFWIGRVLVAVTHGRGLFWIDLSDA